MFIKNLLNKLDKTARGTLAVGLAALTGATVLAVMLTANAPVDENKRPTLRFRCMDFALIEDGSIQARVRVSVENMERFAATGFNIKFNPYYIQPAHIETISGERTQVLATDGSGGEHFEADPAMAWVKTVTGSYISPLVSEPTLYGGGQYQINYVEQGKLDSNGEVVVNPITGPELGKLDMYFELNSKLVEKEYPESKKYGTTDVEYDLIQVMDIFGDNAWEWGRDGYGDFLYINAKGTVDAQGMDNYRFVEEVPATSTTPAYGHGQGKPGNGVNLGSITFKVNPDHLTEMVTNYNKFGASGAGAADLHEFLLGYRDGEETDANNAWFIADYILPRSNSEEYVTNKRTPGNRLGDSARERDNLQDEARVVIDFIFPKVLVKAEVAGGKDLTVNAYQAYGVGTTSDIAATVQRYRPEITATLADAMSTNYIMNWGDTTPTTTTRGGGYKVYRPYDATTDGANPTNLYIDRSHRDTPTDTTGWWVPLNDSEYDPRGGKYMVTQYFWYEEDGQTKMFPQPMEVCLTVTPVELVDANAEGLTGTYSKTQADSFTTTDLTPLGLPKEAVLSLSPVPGPIVLTMPITTFWMPQSIGALTIANGQAQDWSAEGVYNLDGPNAVAIKNYVTAKYPWVTTDRFNKDIKATRTVVADSAYSNINYTAEWVSTTYNGSVTELQLAVNKKVGKDDASFMLDPSNGLPKFRTYLPGGLLIDTSASELPYRTPGDTTTQTANGAYSADAVSFATAKLYYVPGTSPRTDHQENVSRAINLGGWFYVSVCEELEGGNEVWSELMPVYVPPRINYYAGQPGKNYYNAGTGSSDSHYLFDFTGPYAGLYPFYSNSVLPTNVVLPIGYTVGTTYDGFTGAEPGAVGQFWVEAWASAEEDDLTHTAPSPSPWCATEPSASPQPKYNIISNGKPADPPATMTDEPLNPTDFKDAVYSNYGTVENHQGQDHTATAIERVRVRVQAPEYSTPPATSEEPSPTPGPVDKPKEKIRLIHEDSKYSQDNTDEIDLDANNEVIETTYTLRSTGYIQRETFTLTIVNDGDTDIYGLSIDTVSGVHTPAYTADIDHHFEVLVPPAAYLPAGGSTTFVVTYANNLPDTDATALPTLYEDNILITSNAHDATDPLKEYIANFEVSGDATYQVTLEIRPDPSMDLDGDGVDEFPDMGTAKLVVGPAPSAQPTLPTGTQPGDSVLIQTSADDVPPVAQPSENGAGDTYVAGHKFVWVKPEPYDEYKVKSVYYIDGYESDNVTEKRVDLFVYEWRGTGKTTDDDADSTMYFFEMPPKDVTVVVEYYEPIYAKLRLSRLMGYVGIDGEGTIDQMPGATFIDEGKRHNVRWYDDTTKIIQTDPNYTEIENGDTINVMTPEDSSRPERPDYVIVLGDYANTANDGRAVDDMTLVALRTRLRRNYLSPNIDDVEVEFRNYDLDTGTTTPMNSDSNGKTWHQTTGAPTYHNSYVFSAPPLSTDGSVTRTAVRITLRCRLTAAMISEDPTYTIADDLGRTIERHFIVMIIRPAAVKSALNYGNSPKGMIYNNTKISDAAKATAWTNFQNNNYRFNASNRPDKAVGLNNTYWKEAWGGITYAGSDPDAKNYDEDMYALFLILGQPFQDPGFKTLVNTAGFNVDPEKIRRSVEVELLDTSTTATTQRQRFNGARTGGVLDKVTLNLGDGDKGLVTSTTAGDVINDWWKLTSTTAPGNTVLTDQAVRPGIYTLTYSFPDYNDDYDDNGNLTNDPIKVTRPVIILAPVGDVNADRVVNNLDSGYIQNRMVEPLGCMIQPTTGTALDYPAWRLFRYRCSDTNNDRNLNNIDANMIIREGTLVPYYKPTDYVSK